MIHTGHRKLLFIWLPRCYGTSTFKLFNDTIGMIALLKNDPKTQYAFQHDTHITFGHACVKRLMELNVLDRQFYRDSFKFTFVRNPYARAVSLFFYQQLEKAWSFKAFMKYLYTNRDEMIAPISEMNVTLFPWAQGNLLRSSSQWNPMVKWIPDDIDFIGRVETYHEDLDRLLMQARIDLGKYRLYDRNKSQHEDYRSYYDDETRDFVTELYREDIERFDYRF